MAQGLALALITQGKGGREESRKGCLLSLHLDVITYKGKLLLFKRLKYLSLLMGSRMHWAVCWAGAHLAISGLLSVCVCQHETNKSTCIWP